LAVLCVLLIGCGGDQTLTASELVERVNEQGVSMELGDELATSGGAEHLYAVELPSLPGSPKPPPGSEGGPGTGGSLYVFGDTAGAKGQLDACRHAAGLFCFRASNIVIVLDEEAGAIEARRLAVAIKKLGES
jgi:hypothetical protein